MLLLPPRHARVAAASFIWILDKYDRFFKKPSRGFVLLFLASNLTLSYWPNSLELLGQTINVSIIECLTKKVGCGGLKNFMDCHYPPPLTPPPPPPHLSSFLSLPCCVSLRLQQEAPLCGVVSQGRSIPTVPQLMPSASQELSGSIS